MISETVPQQEIKKMGLSQGGLLEGSLGGSLGVILCDYPPIPWGPPEGASGTPWGQAGARDAGLLYQVHPFLPNVVTP